jgi:precorrin-3B methylase
MSPTFDIAIVGLGLSAPDHLTPECARTLRECREILYLDTGVATRALLGGLGPPVVSLYEESYAEGHIRTDAYAHMAVRVIEAALDHAPVGFAIQGHPGVGVYPPVLVRDMADRLGLRVRMLPGISSLDAVFAALGLDPFVQGLQAYEASDLLLRRRPLQADVPLLLWQVGTVETRLYTARRSRPRRFARLVAYLLQTWPAEHEIVAFHGSPHPLAPDEILSFPLGRLAEQAERLHPGMTLLIPPLSLRPICDPELLALLDDPAHLARITR